MKSISNSTMKKPGKRLKFYKKQAPVAMKFTGKSTEKQQAKKGRKKP